MAYLCTVCEYRVMQRQKMRHELSVRVKWCRMRALCLNKGLPSTLKWAPTPSWHISTSEEHVLYLQSTKPTWMIFLQTSFCINGTVFPKESSVSQQVLRNIKLQNNVSMCHVQH